MKKALGIIAATAAACAYVAYKVGKEEPTEEEKIIHEPSVNSEATTEELSEQILKNVESDMEEEQVNQQETETETEDEFARFKNLTEEDIKSIAEASQPGLAIIDKMEDKSERPIQHIVTFQNDLDREEFKNNVINQGYVVTNGDNNELIVLHISKIDKDEILGQVFFLADLTKQLNGEYKGWSIK